MITQEKEVISVGCGSLTVGMCLKTQVVSIPGFDGDAYEGSQTASSPLRSKLATYPVVGWHLKLAAGITGFAIKKVILPYGRFPGRSGRSGHRG
jgi:hypothetical protein